MDNPSKMLHKFKNKELERKVFTHTSAAISANRWAPDLKAPHMDNQRLEFIGDAILKGLGPVPTRAAVDNRIAC